MADQPVTASFPAIPAQVLQPLAKTVGWLRTIVVAVVGLVAALAAVVIYLTSFATHDDLRQSITSHEGTEGHSALSKPLRDLSDRLLRVEIGQQVMAATQARTEETQARMNEKLDRLLSAGAAWRLPANPTPPPQP